MEIFWAECRNMNSVIASVCCIMSLGSLCELLTNHNGADPIFGCFEKLCLDAIQSKCIRICFISVKTTLCILWLEVNPILVLYMRMPWFWIWEYVTDTQQKLICLLSWTSFITLRDSIFQSRLETGDVCVYCGGVMGRITPDSAVTLL